MTTAYTNFIQTSVANTYVTYFDQFTGNTVDLGNSNTLTFFGSSLDVQNLGTEVVISVFPTAFGNSSIIDISSGSPVNITGNYNVPVYIDGTDVGANYFYPFYQNTSTTANGYLANSTAPWQPTNAKFLAVTNGQDGWYRYIDDSKATLYSGNIGLSISSGTQLTANANTTVQVIPYIRDSVTPNVWIASTTLMVTVELIANRPAGIEANVSYFPLDGSIAAGAGMLIRNCVANTRVNIAHAALKTEWIPQ